MSEQFSLSGLVAGVQGNPVLTSLASSDHDAFLAIAADTAFPEREIKLGGMQFSVDREVVIAPQAGVSATFGVQASAPSMGVYLSGDAALSALSFQDAGTVGLTFPLEAGEKLLVFRWDYDVTGSAQGQHPIGGVGSVKFGVSGSHGASFCVACRVAAGEGARTAVTRTLKSWRFPRLIDGAQDLAEGSVVIAEVEGRVAASIAATLGYDFSFLREVRSGGLQGDIGLKVQAGLQATVGFEASGRYLLVTERTGAETVRVRLFKMSQRGWNFGLDFSAKVQGNVGLLPAEQDDLVAAVFGTHPLQVMKELEKWTDPSVPLSKLVAGLTDEYAQELLTKAGITAEALSKRLEGWRKLNGSVQAALWKTLGTLNNAQKSDFVKTMKSLAAGDEASRKAILEQLLGRAGLAESPLGNVLEAAADRGLLSLTNRLDAVSDVAQSLLVVLDGDVMENLKAQVQRALDLTNVVSNPDPAKMSSWLTGRLETFLDKKLDNTTLNELRAAANTILAKRQEIYAKIREALERQYTFDLSYRIEQSTEKTALIDATFDTSVADAAQALKRALRDANYDSIVMGTKGVTAQTAELTHHVSRTSSIDVQFPFYKTSEQSLTDAMAKVRAEEDCGRVLFYEVDASDTKTVKNRMTSQLWGSMAFRVRPGAGVRVGESSASLGYRRRMVALNATTSDMTALLGPFAERYLPGKFGGASPSLETWLATLDNTIEAKVGNGPNEFGDVLLAQEVTLPGRAMLAWFEPRTKEQLRDASNAMSRTLQQALKRALHDSYFSNLKKLEDLATARTVLAWASIPASTSVRLNGNRLSETGESPYWDWMDGELRSAMLARTQTVSTLSVLLERARARLLAAGRTSLAQHYTAANASECLAAARSQAGKQLITSLLFSEAEMVAAAVGALKKASEAAADTGTKPGEAIDELATAGAQLMRAFHTKLNSVFETAALRPMVGLLLLESSAALDPALAGATASAMLSMTVLNEQRTYDPSQYLSGEAPQADQVALSENLVSA